MTILGWLTVTLIAADWIVRLGLALRVIMRRTPVPTTMAWLLILLFAPFVGFIAYFLIGENRLGSKRVALHEKIEQQIDSGITGHLAHRVQQWEPHEDLYGQAARLASAVSGLPALKGHRVELIADTDDMIDRLIRDIDAAQHHCHLLTYIWWPYGRGIEVGKAMMRAAKRGVACRVLVDAVGSDSFLKSQLVDEMRHSGVQVVAALPVNAVRMLFARIDLRNHRKIVVIDGRIGYTGSHNITDKSFKFDAKRGIGPWVDASIRCRGPAVGVLQSVFLADWLMDSDEQLDELKSFVDTEPVVEDGDRGSIVQVVPSRPGHVLGAVQQMMLNAAYSAREEIIMTTPYFVPDEAMKEALCVAAIRGVHVTLVVPAKVDSWLVAAASRAHFMDLLEAGVAVHQYHGGLLHAKTMTIDRKMATIGSANLDKRSFFLNFEITLLVYDDDFASLQRFMQKEYVAQSTQLHIETWRKRSRLRCLADNCVVLMSPVL